MRHHPFRSNDVSSYQRQRAVVSPLEHSLALFFHAYIAIIVSSAMLPTMNPPIRKYRLPSTFSHILEVRLRLSVSCVKRTHLLIVTRFTAQQVHWTAETEAAMLESGNEGVHRYYEQLIGQLNDMVYLIRGKLSKMARVTIGALAVIDVHARDVMKKVRLFIGRYGVTLLA